MNPFKPTNKRPVVIAEAGVNHNGDLSLAKRLVDKAAEAEADYVKFQTFKTENLVTVNSSTAAYQKENCGESSQFEMLKKLELSYDDFRKLNKYCNQKGIGFLSTPFDIESIDFLETLDMDFFKIPSGEITNYPYLKRIAATRKPLVISTGMAEMQEIKQALKVFIDTGYRKNEIILLHCTTEYPAPLKEVNLLAMNAMNKQFGIQTGYSDHTRGMEVSLAAAALGARVIEKHFTLDREMEGPDHKASLTPDELKEMIRQIKNVTLSLGDGEKSPSLSEIGNKFIARKSIVAAVDIKKGELFTEKNLAVKRPGNGISPFKWDNLIGQKSQRDYRKDELIDFHFNTETD